jgi:pimeloyl-ACP methyl ester carboxylesterase
MKHIPLTLAMLLLLAGCADQTPQKGANAPAPSTAPKAPQAKQVSFAEARKGFSTKIVRKSEPGDPIVSAPSRIFRNVTYPSPAGKLKAYLSPDPKDGKKHPAIIWIFGGFDNDIGDPAWKDGPPRADQSASAFRKAGILMMYPALRGGGDGPGSKEVCYGEVDDVLAATDFLAKQDYVDPKRIYLGGHSTGGTLVLLAAEATDRYRAVFSFGPIDNMRNYPAEELPFDVSNPKEFEMRSPIRWIMSIHSPVFVFEGESGNAGSLLALSNASPNLHPGLHFFLVKGKDHFSILSPVTKLLAAKIVKDDGHSCNIDINDAELGQP